MANAISYIKNVGKSVAYTSFDVAKTMVPVFNEFAETNGELATDMYKAIKNIKKTAKDAPSQVMNSKYGKFGKAYLENLNADLRSGNFYNRERIKKANDSMMESFGGDLDFDFGSNDDLDFGSTDDSFGDDEITTNEMIDIVGEKSSNAISNAMARSAEYIVEGTTESNKAIYNQMNNIYGGLHASLATINQNISKMIEFSNEATTVHYDNSRTFYSEITKLDQERNAMLKEILETVKKIETPAPSKEKSRSSSSTYSDLVSYDGTLDISKYKNVIKKNLNDKSGGVFDMINMAFEMGLDKEIAASPVSGLMKIAMTAMIPYTLQKSLDNFNKSISGVIGSVLMNIKKKSRREGGIWDTISDIFGIDTSLKTSLNTSDYEKGKVPFDGVTKKAIIEVIPTYLAKILSAVSGEKETRYNYESGKFVTMEQLKKEFDSLKKDSAERAAYELDSVVRNKKGKLKFRDDDDKRQFEDDWEMIKQYMFDKQVGFNTKDKNLSGKSFGLKGGLASDRNVRALQKILGEHPELLLSYANNLYREIDNHNSRMRDFESSGTMTALANNSESKTSAVAAIAGEANRSTLSELVAIHKELSYIRMYGFGGGKGKGGKRPSFKDFNAHTKSVDSNVYDKAQSDREKRQYDNIPGYDVDDEVSKLFSGEDEDSSPTKKATKSFSERMHEAAGLSAKMSVLVSSATDLAKKPAAFIVSMLDKADERLYDLIYGPKGDKKGDKSFIGKLFTGLEKVFNKFSDFMTDKILEPLKEKFTGENIKNFFKDSFEKIFKKSFDDVVTSVKDYLFGRKDASGKRLGLGGFVDEFKSEMKSAFGWVKNRFSEFGNWTGVKATKNAKGLAKEKANADLENKAQSIINLAKNSFMKATELGSGMKMVDKTGLAVISKGEMVLPPDMNPFNIAKRKRDERNVKNNLKAGIDNIFEFAAGTADAVTGQKLSEEEQRIAKEKILARKPHLANKMADKYRSQKQRFTKDDFIEGTDFLSRTIVELGNAFKQTADAFTGNSEETDKFKEKAVSFISKIKDHGASMAAGATIGAGVSVLTGLVGGPLVGAAVGAGSALLIKSQSLQKMLFGDFDENGDRKGGLLSKELSNNIHKYLPDMGKGATIGGILAALPIVPGGPVAGIIVGSALGFAKNNDAVQKALFGEDENGGFLGTKEQFQNKVRTLLPKMGAGALAGLVAGPFGVTANILLGSAIGFATDTNIFKDVVFGKADSEGNRTGGIFGAVADPMKEFFKKTTEDFKEFFNEDIKKPVVDAMAPLKKQFELVGKSISDTLSKVFEKSIGLPLERAIREHIIDPLGNLFGKLFNVVAKPIKTIVSAPFKVIGAVGDHYRKKHIKSGNADYMTAAERIAFRKDKGLLKMGVGDKYNDFDESLLGMSREDLSVAANALSGIRDSQRSIRDIDNKAFDTIKKSFDKDTNIDSKIRKTALKLLKSGSYEQAQKFIQGQNIPEDSKVKILAVLSAESAKMKVAKNMKDNADKTAQQMATHLQSLGLNLSPEMIKKLSKGDKEADKLYKMIINEELSYANSEENPTKKLNEDEAKRHNETVNILREMLAVLKQKSNITDDSAEVQGYRDHYEQNIQKRKEYADRFNVDFLDDVTLSDEERATLGDRFTIGKYKLGKNASQSMDDIKATARKKVARVKANARVLRHSQLGDTLLGDNNGEWRTDISNTRSDSKLSQSQQDDLKNNIARRLAASRTRRGQMTPDGALSELNKTMKTVAASTAVMAHVEGLDVNNIDTDKPLDSITSAVKNKMSKAKNTVTQFVNGHPLKLKKDKNGDLVPDSSSAENKDTMDIINEEQETQKGILAGITGLSASVGGFFKNFFGKKDDEEENIFTKIWKFLTGENSDFNLGNILLNAIPLALTGLGLGGKLDNIASALTGGAFGHSGSNSALTVKDKDGNNVQIKTDENGNPIKDADGNYITIDGKPVSGDSWLQTTGAVSTMSLSDRLKYNTVRNTVTGKGSIVGTVLKTNKITKGVANKVSNAISPSKLNATKIDDSALKMMEVADDLKGKISSWANAIKKVPMLSKYADKIDDLARVLLDTIIDKLPNAAASLAKASASLAKAVPWILAATAVVDFTTGWQDASTILKIKAENVTLPQKIICGLVRTIKNFIPIIGTFIPDSLITDLFIDYVASWFNMDVSALKSQRDAAQAELDEYNAAHGTNYTWAEYNKKILGNYTWTESIGNAVTSLGVNAKEGASKVGNWISEKAGKAKDWVVDKAGKAGNWISEKAGQAKDWVVETAGKAKNWVTEKATALKDKAVDFISPAIKAVSEKVNIAKDLGSYAITVVKDTWDEMISGESKDTEGLRIDENDEYGAHKKIIYNIVKILGWMPSQVVKLGRAAWDKIKPFVDGIASIGKGVPTTAASLFTKCWNGDLIGAITDTSGNASTGIKGLDIISVVVNSLTKMQLAIPGLITSGVGLVVRNFDNIINSIKSVASGVGSTVSNFFTNAWNGNLVEMITDKSGNVQTGNGFVDGISSVLNGAIKIPLAIPGLITSGVGLVVRNFDNILDGVKTIGAGVGATVSNFFTNAWNGNIADMITDTSGNAQTGNGFVDGISSVINGGVKLSLAIPGLLTATVGGVVSKLSAFVSSVADAGKLSDTDKSLIKDAKEGKITVFTKDYWKSHSNKTGLAGGFNQFITLVNKVLNVPAALLAQINPVNMVKNFTDQVAKFLGIDDSETKSGKGSKIAGKGSGIAGRGSAPNDTFISQLDPKYANKRFNIASDSQIQTLGDSGCAPAAAAMAINATTSDSTTMEEASKNALKYKVRNDGVNATYFNDEFARHGISANYITSKDRSIRQQEITSQLMSNNKVVLMGSDATNSSKQYSPFGPNPHYVVANGMSEDGKYVYINDPESNRANIKYSASKVFGNTTLGIVANAARGTRSLSNKIKHFVGRGTYGTDSIEYKVWTRLRGAGYSEVQVAGIMGNIYQECRFNPSLVEKGSGVGFGLIQWSYGRRTAFESYAASLGKSPSDVDTQINFLLAEMTPGGGANGHAKYQFMTTTYEGKSWPKDSFDTATDVVTATKAFCYCFERPSEKHAMIDVRINAANDYLKAFTGVAGIAGTYKSGTSLSGSTGTSSGGIIGELYGVFNNLASAYGLTNGTANTSLASSSYEGNYTTGEYHSGTYNTSGNVCADPELAAKQRALVQKMYSVQNTLKYAQNNAKYPGSRNPDDGSGDCSSTVQWAYKKVLGVDPSTTTESQRTDPDTYTVAHSVNDESKLQLGDLLLKHGHVEMYAGDGKMIGHGGGQDGKTLGPTVKNLNKSGSYNLVRRWVGFKGKGSGIPENGAYSNALKHIKPNQFNTLLPMGYDSETIEKDKISVMQFNNNKLSDNTVRDKFGKPVVSYTGRASNVVVNTQPTKSNDDLLQVVKSIVQLLVQIVSNTDQLNSITKLLGEYITAISSSDGSKQSKEMAVLAKQNLINALQSGNNNSSSPNAQLMRLIESTEQIARQ